MRGRPHPTPYERDPRSQALEELRRALLEPPRLWLADYPRAAAIVAECTVFELLDRDNRKKRFIWPRGAAMALAARARAWSLPRIGQAFGGRDHTTVLYAREADWVSSEERAFIYSEVEAKLEIFARFREQGGFGPGSKGEDR